MAKLAGKVWKEYGALEYKEWISDDVKVGKLTSFPRSVKLKPGETVVFAWIVYKSRASRSRQRQGHERPTAGRHDGPEVDALRRQTPDLRRIQDAGRRLRRSGRCSRSIWRTPVRSELPVCARLSPGAGCEPCFTLNRSVFSEAKSCAFASSASRDQGGRTTFHSPLPLQLGEDGLVGGDQGNFCTRGAHGGDRALHGVGLRRLPAAKEPRHGGDIHVRGGRDATRAAVPKRVEQSVFRCPETLQAGNASSSPWVFFQSPELSLSPTTVPECALSKRPMSGREADANHRRDVIEVRCATGCRRRAV